MPLFLRGGIKAGRLFTDSLIGAQVIPSVKRPLDQGGW